MDDKLLREIVRRVDTAEVARSMNDRFRTEIDSYGRLTADVIEGPVFDAARRNLELFLDTLAEGRPLRDDELQPLRDSARRRAAEGLPLEDLLHAYRLGGRLGWEALIAAASPSEQAALLPSVARLMEHVDRVSDAVTATYHDERRHLMSAEERRMTDLFQRVVAGAPVDSALRQAADQLGFPLADAYVPFGVVLYGGPPHAHAQAAAALRTRGLLALSEGERIVGLLHSAKDGELDFEETEALVAYGDPAPRSGLDEALQDVRLLLDIGSTLGHSGELTAGAVLSDLLLARSPHLARTLRTRVLGPLEQYGGRRSADLLDTLEVFISSDLDRRRAAEQLHVHPNTLDYRIRRIEELTGLRFQRPDDLVLITLAVKERRFEAARQAAAGSLAE